VTSLKINTPFRIWGKWRFSMDNIMDRL